MFGAGGLSFLPMLGGLFAGGLGGGGMFQLGFTLLSGLLQNIGSPRHPGFDKLAAHPGFNNTNAHPGFGSLVGGPNVSTVGAANGYFGTAYTSQNSYSVLPQTPSGQYYGNAGYNYGNQGIQYGQYSNAASYPTYGAADYRSNQGQLSFFNNPVSYQNWYSSYPSAPIGTPSYSAGQTFGSYGSAPAPYSQNYAPVMSHYGFGSPQQYNPAATLYGHQNGSVQMNYGQPHWNNSYGGPNGHPPVHNHYHIHVHNHNNYPQPTTPTTPTTPAVTPTQPAPTTPVLGTQTQPPKVHQTRWGRVPHVNVDADYGRYSKLVQDRITDGDASRYADPRVRDGMYNERNAAWHVFQQNDSLRLDMKSGYFYETKPDGSKVNRFHMSAVSNLERQANPNMVLGSQLVNDFLNQRGLLDGAVAVASGVDPRRPSATATSSAPNNAGVTMANFPNQAQTRANASKAGNSFG